MKTCPNCSGQLRDTATFCRYCGTKLDATPVPQQPAAPAAPAPVLQQPAAPVAPAPVLQQPAAPAAPAPAVQQPSVASGPRTVTFVRLKVGLFGSALKVCLDGDQKNPVAKIANGKTYTMELDQNAHEILLIATGVKTSFHIPKGGYHYRFFIEFSVDENKKSRFFVYPETSGKKKNTYFSQKVLDRQLLEELMKDSLRDSLKAKQNAQLEIEILEESWSLYMLSGESKDLIFTAPLAFMAGTTLMGAVALSMEQMNFSEATLREKEIERVMNEVIAPLSDYCQTGKNTFAFRG